MQEELSHYKILEKLGEGGMGVVHKALDTHLDRYVAIKFLRTDQAVDQDRRRRFIQEAKAASALNHPGIVTVHDIASDGETDYIVMEWVAGKTLDSLIPRRGMRIGEALKYAVQAADAIAAAHAAGIIHRDLKPANIMVTDAGLAKILDFGLAKLKEPPVGGTDETRSVETSAGVVMGTAPYMSPEQAEARPLDARSDIFSFGAVLYEMVTGHRAFEGGTTLSTLSAIVREEPKPPRQIAADIPAELERVILRCLRKDPARRFQTMADLKVALEELKEESDSGRLGVERVTARPRRRSVWMAAVLVVAVGATGVWLGRKRSGAGEQPATPIPLTSYAGRVDWPAFSPDGKQVAFSWNGENQDNHDIYLKLVGPGPPLRLTTNPATDQIPAWSPDGRQIAFLRRTDGGHAAIMIIPALRGPERRLAEGMCWSGLAWSRNGQYLVVPCRETQDGGRGLFAVSVASGQMRRLTSPPPEAWSGDTGPAISPDGRTVAFSRSLTRANSEIYLLPVSEQLETEGEPRRLTHEDRSSGRPAWTPDGKKIVFDSGGSGAAPVTNLMIVSALALEEKAERLAGGELGEAPAVSSTGGLVYMRWVRDENIWRLNLSRGQPAQAERFVFSTRRDVEPRFSADGKMVAFTSDRSGSNEVWTCNTGGSNQLQITTLGTNVTSGARWSPDGRRMVFLSNKEGQQEIYLTTPDGGAPLRLTQSPAHESAPSWSRDGRWIYFASNRQDGFQIWKMPPEANAAPVRVTKGGGYCGNESVDGKTLYYTKRDDRAVWALWKLEFDGGEETRIIQQVSTWGDFDVTGTGVYYVDSPREGAKLRLLRFRDGADVVLATLAKRPSFGISAAPDDSAVLFTQYDQESTELMLLENLRPR